MERVEGKLISVVADDVAMGCQQDITINFNINTETDEPCKPILAGTDGVSASKAVSWANPYATEISWDATFNAALLIETVTSNPNYIDLVDKLVNKSEVEVTIEVLIPTMGTGTIGKKFEGIGIMSGLSLNAPTSGKANQDVTVTGKGKPTWTDVPFVAPGG